ncbi:hypothetical protein NDU88_002684 [Pleurodeles waltl]|uniref:Uncharacterized protein n=1 Tax=Pleurodeles waltl TaxID=8319 RepID=A0AAV7Q9K8_PLEWA|nr:hypothetical protein NDU88_002684 [Pleurodeles waltl]
MRRGADGPVDGLVCARRVPGGRTWRPVAVPGGGTAGPRGTSEAWQFGRVRRRPGRRRAGMVRPSLGALEVCRCSPWLSGGSRPERLGRPPGCLLRTHGSARSWAVSAVVVVARGG